jgi:thioredoxin reductase (NADPH)
MEVHHEANPIDRVDTVDPTDPYLRTAQTFPVLTQEQIDRAQLLGQAQPLPKGTISV